MKRRSLVLGTAALGLNKVALASFSSAWRKAHHQPNLGVYPYPASTNPNQSVSAISTWLDASLDHVITYLPHYSWSAFSSFSVPNMEGVQQFFSVPLTITGTALSAVNAGTHDADFTAVANKLAAFKTSGIVRVRFGWEFNTNSFPWAANTPGASNTAADYVAAYQRAVRLFRAVSPRFRFCWCSNSPQANGSGGIVDPSQCYPGDTYVDVIGQDVYFNASSGISHPFGLFDFFQAASNFGMDWAANFAQAHGKLLSIDEWGLNTDAFAVLISRMAGWLKTSQAAYHAYWMSNQAFAGDLSGNQYPNAAAAFIQQFGRQVRRKRLSKHYISE